MPPRARVAITTGRATNGYTAADKEVVAGNQTVVSTAAAAAAVTIVLVPCRTVGVDTIGMIMTMDPIVGRAVAVDVGVGVVPAVMVC